MELLLLILSIFIEVFRTLSAPLIALYAIYIGKRKISDAAVVLGLNHAKTVYENWQKILRDISEEKRKKIIPSNTAAITVETANNCMTLIRENSALLTFCRARFNKKVFDDIIKFNNNFCKIIQDCFYDTNFIKELPEPKRREVHDSQDRFYKLYKNDEMRTLLEKMYNDIK